MPAKKVTKGAAKKEGGKPPKKPAARKTAANKTASASKKRQARKPDTTWHDKFLKSFRRTRSVTNACKAAGVSRRCAYKHRKEYPELADAWQEAKETNVDDLIASALERAIEGHLEPVFYKGMEIGNVRKYETVLTIFMLKALRPERFNLERDANTLTVDAAAAAVRGAVLAMEQTVPAA
mgnify:CR=1 FL=1